MKEQIFRDLYNQFNPFMPLSPTDETYVDCKHVRGEGDILVDLGKHIQTSDQVSHQLYTGHRGAGKSTELLKLADNLEKRGFRTIYFAADAEDIDPEDTQYTDILIACTRHLLKELKGSDSNSIWNWIRERMNSLKDVLETEITLEAVSVEAQILEFAKLTATLKASPGTRARARQLIEPHTVSLIDLLNKFIADAMQRVSLTQLVLIVDNLDRITRIVDDKGVSNYEEIFITRSEQLKAIDCHVVYTVPISFLYSPRSQDLSTIYSTEPQILPMIMVRNRDNSVCQPGLLVMKDLVMRRIQQVSKTLRLEEIFEKPEILEQICLMSGGHIRTLMLLMQSVLKYSDSLPVSEKAAKRAFSEVRYSHQRSVKDTHWTLLASVSRTKRIINNDDHRELLASRCILEYRFVDPVGSVQCWHDVNPLIVQIPEFQTANRILEEEASNPH